MENSFKIDCTKSTYVNKFFANRNFSSENILLSGNFYENPNVFNNLKTILEFNLSNLDLTKIDRVYLSIFVTDLQCSTDDSVDLVILPNILNINTNTVTWNNYPRTNTSNNLVLCNITWTTNSYFKIDITNLFKNLTIKDNILSLTIDTINRDSTSLIEFASINSNRKPYLNCIFKEDSPEDINNTPSLKPLTLEDLEIHYEHINKLLETFETNIDNKLANLKNAIDNLNSTENSMNLNKIDTLALSIDETNKKIWDLDNTVNSNSQEILKLNNIINDDTNKITLLNSNITTAIERLNSISNAINNNNNKLSNLDNIINSNNAKIDNTNVLLKENTEKIWDLDSSINSITENIVSSISNKLLFLNDFISINNLKIEELSSTIADNSDIILSLNTFINGTNNKLNDIADNINSKFSTLEDFICNCNNNINTLLENLSIAEASINDLKLQIDDKLLIEKLSTLSNNIIQSTTVINKLLDALNNISISTYE